MGSNIYKRLHLYITIAVVGIFTNKGLAQPIADFSINAPVPNCNPAVYSFTDLTTGGVAPLTYEWNFGVYPGVNSIFQNPSTTYLGCGTFTVQLIVTDGNGDKDTATQNLTVYCVPTASFDLPSTSGCTPFPASFNSTSTPGSGVITTYVWDFGDGFSGSGSNPNHTYNDAGCKQVTLIVTNSFNCVADTTINNVLCAYTPPQAGFTSSANTSCSAPFTVNYQDTSHYGLAPYSYQWIFDGGDPASDTIANPSVTYNTPGNFSTTLIITDVNGCTDTIVYANYVVIANNTADITIPSLFGCPPFNVNLTGVASSVPVGYSWSVTPSGSFSNASAPTTSLTINDTGTFNLCLVIDFGGGCTAQKCTTIVTHTPPNAYYSIDGLTATCLRPNPISFIDSSTGSNLSYSWSFPSGIPASANTSTPDTVNYVACGTYSASLLVTDDFGCTDTYSTPNFLTITCPVANFTLAPSSGCVPLTVNFNSTTSTGTPVQWEWNFGDVSSGAANTSSSQNPSHVYNTPGCYTISLITTSAEGCKDTIVMNNAVCCSTPPVVAFTGTPLENCANQPIFFTNQSTGTYPYSTYTWDFYGVPPYNNNSNAQNPTHIYEDTGYFDVTLIVSNYGCADTLTIVDMVHLLPPVAVINLTRSCGNPYVVTLSGTNSLGADTYTWVIPGGNPPVSTSPTVTVTYTTTGNKSASLYVTNDSTGCYDQTNISFPIRDVVAHFTGNPLTGCAPLTSCMTNTSVDAVSYAWLVTNSLGATVTTSTSTNPCFTLSTPGVYSVRLIATDQFGCKDTLLRPSYISVWGPIADFSGLPLSGCVPLDVAFTDLSTAPNSTITSWSWNFGDPTSGALNTSSLQNPSHTYNLPGYYTVTLTVTDNHGCTSTKTIVSYIHAIQPNASFILTDTTVCAGSNACFINTSTGTGLTYNWGFGNGSTSSQANPCFTYNTNGNYTITLSITDATGCVDTAVKYNYVNVTHPTANLVADTTNSSCPPLAVQFTNLSTDIDASTTYYWMFGDGQVSSAPNPSHIYNIAGTFDVTLIVTNQNGCKDTIVFNNYITIGGPQAFISQLPTSGCVPHYTCFEAVSPSTISFTWNYGDGTVEVGGDSMCHTYTSTGTFYSELILNDGIGCIYAMPVGVVVVNGANCNFNLDNPTLCTSGTVQFTDSSYGTSPVATWNWNFGDAASGGANTSSLQNPSHFFASPGTYNITLNITTVDGCTNSHSESVTVNPAPVAYFDRVDSSTCAPDSIHFFDETISSSTITNWYWNFGDPASGTANTDTLQNTVHFYHFPGTYSVTLTVVALNGCSHSISLPVYVHDTVIADAGTNQMICYGTSSLLTASGGANYTWSPGATLSNANVSSPIASPLVTTTYTVTVSNIFGCSDQDTVVVTVNPLPIIASLTHDNDTCAHDHAHAVVLASSGTSPYTYSWNSSPVQTSSTANNLHGNHSYTVVVTDANGCTVSGSVFITDLPGPDIDMHHTNTTCGYVNGSAWVTVQGGNGGLTYQWNNGATTSTINNIPVGTYDVTVTDQFGCKEDDDTHVNNTAGPTATISANPTTCSNNNSYVNLTPSGGTNPLHYLWSNGATTPDLSNQFAGNYSVTITDANSCTYTVSTTVTDMPSPALSLTQVDATCQTNNASIDVTVTNGTAPFNYNWNNNTYITEDLTNIFSGNYSLTITDANGCTDAIFTLINDTPVPSLSSSTTSSTCGNHNGSIDLTVSGGQSPYNFVWSNGATTEDLDSVFAGVYSVTVTGANGCTISTIVNLNDISAPSLSLSITNNTCGFDNGNISLSLIGGTTPFNYTWSNGATTQNISSLAVGIYFVSVVDGNGCIASVDTELINIPGPALASSSSNSTCGNANGSIDLIVSGGTSPFTYLWSNGTTTEDLLNAPSGIYSVTITDANNCTATTSDIINNTNGPAISYTVVNTTCTNSNGSIDLTISGGTAPYAVSWNSGAFTTEDLNSIPSGNYSVVVSDANACSISGTIAVSDFAAPTLLSTVIDATCGLNDGSIDLTVSGGTSPFTYNWNSGSDTTADILNLSAGAYNVVVTDSNSCSANLSVTVANIASPTANAIAADVTCQANNGTITLTVVGGTSPFTYSWSNGETTQNLSNLSTGIYTVTITDANLCSTTASAIVSDVPGPFSAMASSSATCGQNNGSIDLAVTAGLAPYNYLWSNGATTQDINGLSIGWYYATITDQNNCVLHDSAEVININGPSLTNSVVDETCGNTNGQVYLTVNGGTSPYTYHWNNSAATQNLNYVSSGNYFVTVTDANNCTEISSASIMNTPGPSAMTFGSSNSTCGNANGKIWVSVTGGTSPYSYHWNTVPVQASDTAFNLIGGNTYSVTVTDANLCTISGSVSLLNTAGPTSSLTKTNCTCAEFNGAIALTTSGGTAPYTYAWSNGETTEDIDSLQPATYSVTITDANGCTATNSATINNIFGPYLNYTSANTTCSNSNGSIDLTVLGGTAPFYYNWNSGQFATQDLTNLAAGNYTIQLTDAAGCQVDTVVNLTDVAGPLLAVTFTPSTCGYNNGFAAAVVSGGTAPFIYNWSNASVDSFAANLFAGNYFVTVTDSNNCVANGTVNVTNIAGPSLSATHTDATCGLNNGTVDLTVTGGTAPFTFDWSSGTYSTEDLTNLAQGTYIAVVTDSNSCMAIEIEPVDTLPAPHITATIVDAPCGSTSGAIDVTVIGGTSPITFAWSDGATTEDLNSLIAGTYTLTLTDGVSCAVVDSFVVNGSSQPTLATSVVNSTCGNANGSIDITVSNGTAPFTYTWSNGETTEDISSLTPNIYDVTVTDANGCSVTTSVLLNDNLAPEITLSPADANCYNNNGQIALDVAGGAAPFSYIWSNGATVEDLDSLSANNYSVTVTDANGCQAFGSADVFSAPAPSSSLNVISSSCNQSNGSVTASVVGGFAPYNYLWSNGAITSVIGLLSSNLYFVTITDNAGCSIIDSAIVGNSNAPTVSGASQNSTCGNATGSIDVTVSGGTLPYTYLWSDASTSEDVSSLISGNYFITTTDSSGCVAIDSFTITTTPAVSISLTAINANCGQADGSLSSIVTGGTSPFTYLWSNGATTSFLGLLSSGIYSLTVTDSVGCSATANATVSNNGGPTLSASTLNSTCGNSNGSIALTVTGGTSPYTYQWSNGATSSVFGLLSPGAYSVTVTDAVGCVAVGSFNVSSSPIISLTDLVSNESCSLMNGGVDLTVTGGTSPFIYSWSNGITDEDLINISAGTYSVTVTDSSNCVSVDSGIVVNNLSPEITLTPSDANCYNNNGTVALDVAGGAFPFTYLWSNGETIEDLDSLSANTYFVTVMDANGCAAFGSADVFSASSPSSTLTSTSASCNQSNGSVTASVVGGFAPYTYLWSNGATTQNVNALLAGNYFITITDVAGCVIEDSITVINSNGPTLTVNILNSTCGNANGSVALTVVGGTSPYNYSWSNGATTSVIGLLSSGTFTVTVTDATGCFAIDSFIINSTSSPTLFSTSTNASCGQTDGTIDLTVVGGNAPYTILWSNGATTSVLGLLSSGIYDVTVTDSFGCSATTSATVSNNNGPVASTTSINSSCGNNNGSIDLSVVGGTFPYTYSWSNGATDEDIDSLLAGNYDATITDATGCAAYATVNISTTTSPLSLINATSANCNQNNGAINLTVTAGTSPYTYQWSNGATTSVLGLLSSGMYSVTATDSLGCFVIDSIVVGNISGQTISLAAAQPTCANNFGSIDLTVSGGVAPYTYQWSNASTTEDINSLSSGNYFVTVFDGAGCVAIDSAVINNFSSPVVILDSFMNATCLPVGAIYVSVAGGTSPYTYSWSNGATTSVLGLLSSGTYSVTVTDALGCSSTLSQIISGSTAPTILLSPSVATCNQSNGSIDLGVIGGIAPYTYAWSNGATTEDIDSLTAGGYTVSVTDANGCVVLDSVFVGNAVESVVNGFIVQPTCTSAGSIDVSIFGGVSPFTYTWSNGATTEDLSSLSGGTYTLSLTDALGCQVFSSFVLNSFSPIILTVNAPAAICNGDSTQLTASGATNYSWSPSTGLSATTGNAVWAIPSANTTYTVTATDTSGCSAFASITVTVNPLPTISATPLNSVLCYGDSTLLTVNGALTYTWNPTIDLNFISATSAYASPISNTTYSITGTDSLGCSAAATVTVVVLPQVFMNVSSPDTELCYGETTTLIASGAINYTWTPSTGLSSTTGANVTASPATTTTYYVTGVDANGCSASDSIIVTVHPPIVVGVLPVNPTICMGSTVQLTATGAVNYSWSPSDGLNQTTGAIVLASPTVTTTYIITGTDSFGCAGFNAVIVSIGTSFTLFLNATPSAICHGDSATLSVGGAFNATYNWTPSVNYLDSLGSNVSVIPDSTTTYTVTAADAFGCTGTTTETVIVNTPPIISATNATICDGSSTTLSVTGANTYTWTPATGLSSVTGDTQIAGPTTTTTYTIIGVDVNGCIDTTTSVMTVNPLPTLNATPSVTSICNGSSATINVSGANIYQWTPSTGLSADTGSVVTAQPTVTTTYTIFGSDTLGCTNSVTAIVNVGAPVTIVNTPLNPTLCFGDSITIALSGAVSYQWTPSTGLNTDTGSVVVANPTVSTTYTVIGTDANGCTGMVNINVMVNPNIVMNGATTAICFGQGATLTATGAFMYMWTPDATLSGNIFDSTVTATPLVNTTYTVTGMNIYGCSDTAQFIVNVNPLPIVSLDGLAPSYCVAQSADTLSLTPQGGIITGVGVVGNTFNPSLAGIGGPYIINYTFTDSLGCSAMDEDTTTVGNDALITATSTSGSICNNSSTTITATGGVNYTWTPSTGLNATAGSSVVASPTATTTYIVTGTNASGCSGADTVVVNVYPSVSISIVASAAAVCPGTSTLITASGAVNYTWTPAVQSSNANGDTVTVIPFATATYTVNATDANGCSATAQTIISILANPNVTVNNANICSGDAATLVAQGATTYNWISLGSTNDSVAVTPLVTTSYTVIGNVGTCADTAIAVVSMLPAPTVTVNNDTICAGASATLTASGAANFTWLPLGVNGNSISVSPLATTTYTLIGNNGSCADTVLSIVVVNPNPVATLSGLNNSYCTNNPADTLIGVPAGGVFSGSGVNGNIFYPSQVIGSTSTVTYTYTDSNGCSAIDTQTVSMNGSAVITVNPALSTICNSSSVTITASGASNYSWSPSTGLNTTSGAQVIANPSVNTTYTVVGTDGNGCAGQTTSEVVIAPNLVVNLSASADSICIGASTVLSVTGGTNYSWTPSTALNSTSGSPVVSTPTSNITYTVVATNASGCSGTANIPVVVLAPPVVTVTSDTVCVGQFATLVASGASNYQWSTNALGNTISVNPAVTTSYSVVGMNGTCSDTATGIVTVNPLPNITATSSGNFVCNGGTVQLDASGANAYSWTPSTGLSSTNSSTVTATLTSSATYTVTGVDTNGCANTQSLPVNVGLPVVITTASTDTTICFGASATLTVNGNYNFVWSPSTGLNSSTGNTITASPTSDIIYTVTGTDVNGCSAQITIGVRVNSIPVVTATSSSNTLCTSTSAILSASGAMNYMWTPSAGLSSSTGNTVSAIPNANITYIVTGTDSFGCAATASVNINVLPAPVISISASAPAICFGDAAMLSASGANNYSWTPNTNLSSTTGATVTANPTVTTTYFVSAIDSNGCVGNDTMVLTVNPLPILVPTALDSSICLGALTTLSVTGATYYTWTPSIGLSATTGSNISATPTSNTTYAVQATDANGCKASASVPVIVNSIPVVAITNNPAICPGDFATLIAIGAVNYHWSTNALGDSVAVNPLVSTTYSVVGTDANGCSASDTATVSINPVPNISASPTQTSLCYGSYTEIMALGGNNYTWTPAASLNASTGSSVTASPQNTTTYIVTGDNSFGCTDTASVVVTVNQLPAIALGPDVDICEGSFAQLSASDGTAYQWSPTTGLDNPYIANPVAAPVNTMDYVVDVANQFGCHATDTIKILVHQKPAVDAGPAQMVCFPNSTQLDGSGAATFSWQPTDFLQDTSSQTPVCTPLSNITYTLTTTDSFGCNNSDTVSVQVRMPFTIQANPDVEVCRNDDVQLNATGGNNYTWTPSVGLDNPYIPNPVASPSATTSYVVTSTDGQCFSSSDTVKVEVHQLPMLYAGADAQLLYGQNYQLYGYSNSQNFQWSPPTFLSCTDCINPMVVHLDQPMTYYFSATDSFGCRAEDSVHISLTCNDDVVYVPDAFTPNGDHKNDEFRVRTYGMSHVNAFRVFNRWGEMVFETNDVSQGWDGTWQGQLCSPAVYVYYLDGVCADGSQILKKGNVTLIR